MLKYILCAIYVLFSVSGLTLIKIGGSQPIEECFVIPIVNVLLSKYSILGIMCYGISFCLYICVVSKFDLGLIIPILGGIVNILIIVIAYFVLKESLTINMIVGAIIITVGIIIMNIGKA